METFRGSYNPWHVNRQPSPPPTISIDTPPPHEDHPACSIDMSEWELLSQLHPGNNLQLDDLDMLGHRDFDTNHNWGHTHIPLHLQNLTISFLDLNRSSNQAELQPFSTPTPKCFSPTQRKAFEIIMSHSTQHTTTKPLCMIIQGTASTKKSYLIGCLQASFSSSSPNNPSPLLLLAPTGVTAFNINALTIHSALRIPINTMLPLECEALANLQERLLHIHYVLID